MRVVVSVLALLLALLAVVIIVGAMLPAGHVVSRGVRFNQQPEVVWDAIGDFGASPSWRDDLEEVRQLPDENGHPVWRETYKDGAVLTLETVESDPPRRLVRKIVNTVNTNVPLGGTWEFDIVPSDGGSQLIVTEHGEVHNPIFRLVGRFIVGRGAVIDGYLESLRRKLVEGARLAG